MNLTTLFSAYNQAIARENNWYAEYLYFDNDHPNFSLVERKYKRAKRQTKNIRNALRVRLAHAEKISLCPECGKHPNNCRCARCPSCGYPSLSRVADSCGYCENTNIRKELGFKPQSQ